MSEMLSLLNGLWIIDPNGLCLLHQDFSIESKEKIDETMFSGFLTAILSFTQDLVNDTIERIQMGEREIHYQSFGIFAVAVSANKSKKKAKDLSQYITRDRRGAEYCWTNRAGCAGEQATGVERRSSSDDLRQLRKARTGRLHTSC